MQRRPLIAVTMGDPAGIGPEIVARSIANPSLHEQARLLVIGTRSILDRAINLVGAGIKSNLVSKPLEGVFSAGTADIIEAASIWITL